MENLDLIVWVVVAVLAFAGEVITTSFFLIFFGLGAVVGLALAALGFGAVVQMTGFLLASVASMLILRPPLIRRLSFRNSAGYKMEQASMIGHRATVSSAIEAGSTGTVRTMGGEFWTARALDPSRNIKEGTQVRIMDADGFTVMVDPIELEGE